MTEGQKPIPVTVTANELVARLSALQSRMTDQNDHDDAFLVGLAIQALGGMTPPQLSPDDVRQIMRKELPSMLANIGAHGAP